MAKEVLTKRLKEEGPEECYLLGSNTNLTLYVLHVVLAIYSQKRVRLSSFRQIIFFIIHIYSFENTDKRKDGTLKSFVDKQQKKPLSKILF